jgi:hypothetical protein
MGPAVHFALPVGDRGPCKRGILFALWIWITCVGLSLKKVQEGINTVLETSMRLQLQGSFSAMNLKKHMSTQASESPAKDAMDMSLH